VCVFAHALVYIDAAIVFFSVTESEKRLLMNHCKHVETHCPSSILCEICKPFVTLSLSGQLFVVADDSVHLPCFKNLVTSVELYLLLPVLPFI
jgi:hypothetical protein